MYSINRNIITISKWTGLKIALSINRYQSIYPRAKSMDYDKSASNRNSLRNEIKILTQKKQIVPVVIGGKAMNLNNDENYQYMPYNHKQVLAKFFYAHLEHYKSAVDAAIRARDDWMQVEPSEKFDIWMKTAEILDKENRHKLNAAIMLGQGKTSTQADEDTCYLIDYLRQCATFFKNLARRPLKNYDKKYVKAYWNIRPLNGFVIAIGPFNMTDISVSLAAVPALMGNGVLWKPSDNCILSSYIVYKTFEKAGLPDGIINFLPTNDEYFLTCIRQYPSFAGVNFVGKTTTFHKIWKTIRPCLQCFHNFPRLISECGGKNFHFVHKSADMNMVVEATINAAFSYSGQYCSSCSRLYVPESMWPQLKNMLKQKLDSKFIGDPTDFNTYASAVINENAFKRITNYINNAAKHESNEIVYGGGYSNAVGYYVEPCVIVCKNPFDDLMTQEILGPILSVYVYKDQDVKATLELINKSSLYALTGAVFANDKNIIESSITGLRFAASNLFINSECTKSLNGQRLFSGTRQSGNNKGGSIFDNLLRWCSPQLIEENISIAEDKCEA